MDPAARRGLPTGIRMMWFFIGLVVGVILTVVIGLAALIVSAINEDRYSRKDRWGAPNRRRRKTPCERVG